MAYKHRDIVIAWMDGKTIQFKTMYGQWKDREEFSRDEVVVHGLPSENAEYRIKPDPVRIRHYIYKDATVPHPIVLVKGYSKQADNAAAALEKNPNIIWLDDWHHARFSAE